VQRSLACQRPEPDPPRISLVRLARADADFVHALFRDAAVSGQFIDPTALETPVGARAFCSASPKLTGQHRFAVHAAVSGMQVGLGMVRDRTRSAGYATIGYALAPEVWCRGLGTELARRLCAVAFEPTSAVEVRASVKPTNTASRRVLEKLGFRFVGRRQRNGPSGPVEVQRFVLRRAEWPLVPHGAVRVVRWSARS